MGDLNRFASSDTRLEWPGEEPLFESDLNKHCRGGGANWGHYLSHLPGHYGSQGMGPLARYGSHQETISRRPEQMYTSSHTRLEWPREGPLFELDSNKHQGAKMWALFESPLGYYLCQAWTLGQVRHQCKSLSYVAEYVYQIC